MTDKQKVTLHCPECDSQYIMIDASARWDEDKQSMVLYTVTASYWDCGDCDAEFSVPRRRPMEAQE